jgi:ribA/ribD-fused uncharacterized protein
VSLFYTSADYWADSFSAFAVEWEGRLYPTAEHLYQARKYITADGAHIRDAESTDISELILISTSAHDAKKLGRLYEQFRRDDWSDELKLRIMEEILRAKRKQHPYIARKLAERRRVPLINDSPKDAFWGRGHLWDGQNHLGKLWNKIGDE